MSNQINDLISLPIEDMTLSIGNFVSNPACADNLVGKPVFGFIPEEVDSNDSTAMKLLSLKAIRSKIRYGVLSKINKTGSIPYIIQTRSGMVACPMIRPVDFPCEKVDKKIREVREQLKNEDIDWDSFKKAIANH